MKNTKSTITKLFLSVGGVPIEAPESVKKINDNVGPLGGNLLSFSVQLLLLMATLLSLAFLIWGGIKWILSGGDKHGIEGARGTIIYAIIGLVISFSAFFIINVVGYFFGVNFFPTL